MACRFKLYLWLELCRLGDSAISMDWSELRWLRNSAIERKINE
jgi:hypothetical protein